MPEPLTIATATLALAKTAQDLVTRIYKFQRDTKTVDQTAGRLATEVESLRRACDLICSELTVVVRGGDEYDAEGHMWQHVESELERCNATITNLRTIVVKVLAEGSRFGRLGRQIRLEWNEDQIGGVRKRLATHTQTLLMIVTTVNIRVTHLAPRLANQELYVRLEELQKMVDLLVKAAPTPGSDAASVHTRDALAAYAERVIAGGSVLYQASLTGSAAGGDVRSASGHSRIAEWTRQLSLHDSSTETHYRGEQSLDPGGPSLDSGLGSSMRHADDASDAGDDSDDKFILDVATAGAQLARRAFDHHEWTRATQLLTECITSMERLSTKQRASLDMFEMQYELAVSAYHDRQFAVAKEALTTFLELVPASDAQRRRIFDAAHVLSQLYLCEGSLDQAISSCQNALKARGRLLGKEHGSYLQSLTLMSCIHEFSGNVAHAEILISMVPESRRDALTLDSLTGSYLVIIEAPVATDSPRDPARTVDDGSKGIVKKQTFAGAWADLGWQSVDADILEQAQVRLMQRLGTVAALRTPTKAPSAIAIRGPRRTQDGQVRRLLRSDDSNATDPFQSAYVCADRALRQAIWEKLFGELGKRKLTKLYQAIYDTDLDTAYRMIRGMTSPPELTEDTKMALHMAAAFGDLDLVRLMLDKGFDAHADGFGGELWPMIASYMCLSPLELAFSLRWPEVVRLLLRRGARWQRYSFSNIEGPYLLGLHCILSETMLKIRPCQGPGELIDLLSLIPGRESPDWECVLCPLLNGSSYLKTALDEAFQRAYRPVLNFLVSGHHDLTKSCSYSHRNTSALVPIHAAIRDRNPAVVLALLRRQTKEQLQLRSSDGRDALGIALCTAVETSAAHDSRGRKVQRLWTRIMSCIQNLLEAGANVQQSCDLSHGSVVWHTACGAKWPPGTKSISYEDLGRLTGEQELMELLATY
ncbi:hypothetical protein LTR53_002472 [Teratosphaeriaceae sp. CCFEE 6253]|nr:hypothetical protein LTR53_002472 [Teratosphaeriaceae sp. CCFEE 6253]